MHVRFRSGTYRVFGLKLIDTDVTAAFERIALFICRVVHVLLISWSERRFRFHSFCIQMVVFELVVVLYLAFYWDSSGELSSRSCPIIIRCWCPGVDVLMTLGALGDVLVMTVVAIGDVLLTVAPRGL